MEIVKKGLSTFVGLTLLGIVVGCSATEQLKEPSCAVNLSSEQKMPNLVLIGTDVVNLDTFKVNNGSLGKSYSADLGGASLNLKIEGVGSNTVITRSFQEPGAPAHNREYKSLCISGETLSAPHLVGKIINEGLLLLEQKSNVDGIPTEIWVFYSKVN